MAASAEMVRLVAAALEQARPHGFKLVAGDRDGWWQLVEEEDAGAPWSSYTVALIDDHALVVTCGNSDAGARSLAQMARRRACLIDLLMMRMGGGSLAEQLVRVFAENEPDRSGLS